MTEESWVEISRFDGPAFAEMARAFLVEHGIQVMLRGPSSTTHSLMRFAGDAEVRLLVPAAEVEEAREALSALVPATHELPFRGPAPRARDVEPVARDVAGPRPRNVLAVLVASSVLPIAAAHLAQGCRGEDVVVRRRSSPDFAVAPAVEEVALPPAFARSPSLGPAPR